jgi:hypothetical protein
MRERYDGRLIPEKNNYICDATDEQLESCIGRLLKGGAIEILDKPVKHDLLGRYRCLARVDSCLCVIVVTLKELT